MMIRKLLNLLEKFLINRRWFFMVVMRFLNKIFELCNDHRKVTNNLECTSALIKEDIKMQFYIWHFLIWETSIKDRNVSQEAIIMHAKKVILQVFKAPFGCSLGLQCSYNRKRIFSRKVKFLFLTTLDGLIREYLLHKSS